jgi:O-antigen ligase
VPVSGALQDVGVLAAAGAGAMALVTGDPRRRAVALLAAPVLCVAALLTVVGHTAADELRTRGAELAVAAAVGLAVLVVLGLWLRRRPAAFALLALAALPFRVPVTVAGTTANLLLPLYGVVAAGCVGYAVERLRVPAAAPDWWEPERDRPLRHVELALTVMIVLYALQALYSRDLETAIKNVCFFYVPFALLFRLLGEVRWSRRLLLASLGLIVAMTLVFAGIGFVEFATKRLLITNAKVIEANELKPYFRVNSVFFDPNIYGRWIALTMTLLAAVLLWTRRPRDSGLIAAALAVLWAALVISLSQSSFADLLVGLAVLMALRWRPWPVIAAAAAVIAAGAAVVLFAPGVLNLHTESRQALNRATSGRVDLITGGAQMARGRPLWGFGSGSFAAVYRARRHLRSTRVAAVSHTIPLTIAAEQGIIGEAAYLYLLGAALVLLFVGLRGPPGDRSMLVARTAVAAAFCGLLLHTWVYAAFLEDPLTWALLAVAGALRVVPPAAVPAAGMPRRETAPVM